MGKKRGKESSEEEVLDAEETVNFDWLHLSDGEDEPYEVKDDIITENDLFPFKDPKRNIFAKDATAPCYYKATEVCKELKSLQDNFSSILDEVKSLLESGNWTPWPEEGLYQGRDQSGDWRVIPLVYTFPATDPSASKWVAANAKQCPKTVALLKAIPGLRTALFSRMGGNTRLSAHQGWADLANHVLRCHLPLIVPDNDKDLCGMWVQGEVNFHKERQFLMFDDSKWHKAFNATDGDRIILLFDIMRPDNIPKGKAKAGHTAQLDEFIREFQSLVL